MPRGGARTQPRGPGTHIPPAKREAFEHFAFTERRSIRESSRMAGIAKGTGIELYWALRARRAA